MGDSDWQFVQKILDLSEGHSNAKRARMIVAVLGQLSRQRRVDYEYLNEQISAPGISLAEPAWLLALGKSIPNDDSLQPSDSQGMRSAHRAHE
jgi:hypothetical protein